MNVQIHENAVDRPWGATPRCALSSFLAAVARTRLGFGHDPRLRAAASGSNEAIGSEGGFAIIGGGVLDLINKMVFEQGELIRRCFPVEATNGSASMVLIDETSRVAGSRFGGVATSWKAEAGELTESLPRVRRVRAELQKLTGLWRVTEELVEDSPGALGSMSEDAFGGAIAFAIEKAVFSGSGAGMPLGVMNSSALITIAKETAQEADSIYSENVNKMWARMPARSKRNAIWLTNSDCAEQLEQLDDGLQSGKFEYVPDRGPYLKGRPVIENEHSSTLGDLGDLTLVDLSWYGLLTEDEGTRIVESAHVFFDTHEHAFRFTARVEGLPLINSPITPANGTATQSPFVALAERS